MVNTSITCSDTHCSSLLCYTIQSPYRELHEPIHQQRPCQRDCHLRAQTLMTPDRCHSPERFTVLRTWGLRCPACVKVTLRYASMHNKTANFVTWRHLNCSIQYWFTVHRERQYSISHDSTKHVHREISVSIQIWSFGASGEKELFTLCLVRRLCQRSASGPLQSGKSDKPNYYYPC